MIDSRTRLAAGYAVLILALSSIPGRNFPEMDWLSKDKLIHLAEYAIFMVLVCRVFYQIQRPNLSFLYIFLGIALFGLMDELYQSLIPGRDSSVADWAADSLGALLGLIIYWTWNRYRARPVIHT